MSDLRKALPKVPPRMVDWELVLKRNSIERLKQERPPLRVLEELPDLIRSGYEEIPEEDIVRLYWYGIAHDKPKVGTFMVRLKVPGGLLQPMQLRSVGRLAERFGRDYVELTTRQGLQLHWVEMRELPAVLEGLEEVGLTTVGAEGDTVRNITGCPVGGISREELFDVRPVIEAAAEFFWGNPDYSNLPRKLKITISACPVQCNAPEIHDIALQAGFRNGEPGFALLVGGGLSATPRLARDLGVFVPVDLAVPVLAAVIDVWQHDLRYRLSRAKARLKFLVDDYGVEEVRRKVEERLGRRLEDYSAPLPVLGEDHFGRHPQKQEGYCYVGFPVPSGRATGTQLQQIADVLEEVGGDIRFTREQNFILGNLPEDRVDQVVGRLAAMGFPADRHRLYGSSTACTSHEFCNYSVAETKGMLDEIVATLVDRFGDELRGLTLYMDGCPHACAHHWVGDIGLQGTRRSLPDGRKVEAYDVSLRGGLGREAEIGRPVLRRIPREQIIGVLVRLVEAWISRRGSRSDYTFQAFCRDLTNDELAALAGEENPSGAERVEGSRALESPPAVPAEGAD
ncbi:MAG: ferredoxin--nitrite reductase [Acidobacteriota bacterium]